MEKGGMLPRHVEDITQLLTLQVLEIYSHYMAVQEGSSPPCSLKFSPLSKKVAPVSVEEVLAPLELLYGKTFLSGVGIALHGEESVIRYVEGNISAAYDVPSGNVQSASDKEEEECRCTLTSRSLSTARYVYRVGEHILLSPYYCPCSAYAYQSVRRKKVWCCKHILALRICLALESAGVKQHNILIQIVDTKIFDDLLAEAMSEKEDFK
ncbi:unnamed protein product [Phytomonas sp. Hart1]|nr:unnamed protein product [Phytomonas sp. Hart1]|eukprot:CCW69977.1 unnamed protein product [Phytomonas sp. isolate Hart1]